MNRIKHGVVIGVIALLAGCATEYAYTPPTSEQGMTCVTRCQSAQQRCRNTQVQVAATAKQSCIQRSQQDYDLCTYNAENEHTACTAKAEGEYVACLKYASDRKSCIKNKCEKTACYRDGCYHSPDYAYCDSDFRSCYQQCGGKVDVIK